MKTITQNGSIDSIMYSTNGNLLKKSKVGNYNYGTKINAVTGINAPCDASNPLDSFINTTIQYTPFNQPDSIKLRNLVYSFTYGPDHQRTKTIFTKDGVTIGTRYYVGNYEKFIDSAGTVKHIYYIGGNTIAVQEGGNIKFNYVYTDHLGSLLKITDSTGAVTGEQSFDAWGRIRNYNNWSKDTITQLDNSAFGRNGWLNRGFTGHEHLPQFNIINMNGRLYDPIVGRMLSPDNYNQDATYTQAYNRYSYVYNNPLKYIDPSGWKYVAASANVRRSIPEFMENYNPGGGSSLGKGNWSSMFMQVAAMYGTFAAMNASNNGTISNMLTYGVMNTIKVYELSFENRKGTYWTGKHGNEGSGDEQGTYDYGWQVREHTEFGRPDLSEIMGNATAQLGNVIKQDNKWDLNGDGKFQKKEADNWWLNGHGDVSVDNRKIDWSGLKIPEGASIGKIFAISTTEAFRNLPYETAATYGGTSFKMVSLSEVTVLDQLYHYNYRPNNSAENITRNFLNWFGKPKGTGNDFMIHYINSKIKIK